MYDTFCYKSILYYLIKKNERNKKSDMLYSRTQDIWKLV